MKINEIFENLIKIEPKVVSIETLFNNEETVKNTKYDPDYQRNYVWDDDKATYFVESILLGTEIPPIIYFRNGEKIEIVDGRQRYQTILRFIRNEFKLRKSGLHKLYNIGITSKYFKDLGTLRDDFWDTKLRIIEFSFHTKTEEIEQFEDIVKKEIFKRYNSGITPLKPTEIDKAYYFDNDLNSYIKNRIKEDKRLFLDLQALFHFNKESTEVLLKKIRQLLVQHKIPIKYYAIKKDVIISKYYELLFSQLDENDIEVVFSMFLFKINILLRVQKEFLQNSFFFNRLVSEVVFWALSVIEECGYNLNMIDEEFIRELAEYIEDNKAAFEMDRSSFSKQLQNRYNVIADFFKSKTGLSFANYLITTSEFKKEIREKDKEETKSKESQEETSFDDLRINKPEPSSITIVDICRQMERQRFLIRPPYQRSEVKNRRKSSAIIESILLGIKLPPIFVYKRNDGVSEVLDGQQRLLSILGFLKKEYLDENSNKQKSNKDGYSLNLKDGILKDLNTKNVEKLSPDLIKKILNFDLWIIEINHRYNKDFEPIDLFLRLNTKPYPIKENTFEMWNSYINKEIIHKVKDVLKQNENWFYFRKNNKRMENENIYAALAYLNFHHGDKGKNNHPLEYYKIGERINFRIRSKNEITKLLENPSKHDAYFQACEELNDVFVPKVKKIVENGSIDNDDDLNKNLEDIFSVSSTGRRTQQSFYALWYFLSGVSSEAILNSKLDIRRDLKNLFKSMDEIDSKESFDQKIDAFWRKYKVK